MKKILLMTLFFMLGFLSCGRIQNIPDHLDDDFLFGTTEGLIRTKDLIMILDEEAAKIQEDPNLDRPSVADYEAILSEKENLYGENTRSNVFNLNKLLKIHTIRKDKKARKVKISSGLEHIFIDPEIPFLNEYEILDYEISESKTPQKKLIKKLLGKVRDFHGFPNTDYYILPHFTGNYLVLYKLAPPDKIPYDELPLARRIGEMLAVPFVGYPVEYCQAVKFLVNLRETRKSRPLCKSVPQGKLTKYIRLREHKKRVFQYLQKLDFFKRDFFEGQWLHFQTLVKSPSPANKHLLSGIQHPSFQRARLVKFHPSLGKMDVVEVHNLKQDDEKRVLFIPVKWTDYEIARDSESLSPGFSERLKKDTHAINRPYLQIKFGELITNEFPHQEKGGKSLKSAIITKDYISFDIEITTKGRAAYLMKYAFKRYVKNKDYIEKQWFKKDHFSFFPLFKVKREYYEDPTDHTLADANRFERVVRFDPKKEEIEWYFSQSTSQLKWIRNLGYEAENLINKALREAGRDSGHKIKIVLDKKGDDKELGDIRYNILNLVFNESNELKQFKRGWNIANPVTGEVVSATANVWIDHILSDYIDTLRKYIRFHVYPPAWKMRPFSEKTLTFIGENINTKNLQCDDLSGEVLGITPFLHEKISGVCPEVSGFITDRQQEQIAFHPENPPLEDDDIVSSCAQKLARVGILQSILHGMLHSLGLKDMPSASSDSENFYKNREIEVLFGKPPVSEMTTESHPDPPQYSSVMDYMDLEYPILPVPGKLDIAALRFIYFDKIEKTAGGFLHVPSGAGNKDNPQKSILETAAEKSHTKEDFKNYKICGWESSHPMFCKTDKDYGTSPLEVVTNLLCKSHNYLVSRRHRYDSDSPEKYSTLFDQVRTHYNKWKEYRDNILARQGKSIFDYPFLNPDHIEEYNQIMQTANESPDIKSYYIIRRPIFDYFKRATFTPSKHCIYKKSSSQEGGKSRYYIVALENIEEKIRNYYREHSIQKREVLINCQSPVVQDWIKEALVAEVGFFGKEKRYFIRPNEKTDSVDEPSAFQSLLQSAVVYFSDMLQEPEFGDEYYKEWLAYITGGTDLNPYIDRTAITDPDIPKDTQFERVLGYNIDTKEGIQRFYTKVWLFRQRSIEKYRAQLANDYSNIETTQWLPFYFSYRAFSLTDLRDYARSIPTHPGLHDSEIPFLVQAHKEYEGKPEDQKQAATFEEFIQTHPAVLYNPNQSTFLLPYVDQETNVMAALFRQYNDFREDIKEYEAGGQAGDEDTEIYNEIEDKKAFVEFMLKTYNKQKNGSF